MGRHRFSLCEVCPYLKSVKIKYFVSQLLFIISTVSSDNKMKNKISGDLPLSLRNYCTTFAFFWLFFFFNMEGNPVSSCDTCNSSWSLSENSGCAVWPWEWILPIRRAYSSSSSQSALRAWPWGPADSYGRKWELHSLLRLNLVSVKWYNGKMRLFLFFPHLHRLSWLGSKENLRWIRTEMLSGKKIIFRFENAVGRGSWSLFAEQGAIAILYVNMFFENAFLF